MQVHQIEGLEVDVRIDQLRERAADDLLDLPPVPALDERQHALLGPVHLLVVCAEQEVDELRVRALQ